MDFKALFNEFVELLNPLAKALKEVVENSIYLLTDICEVLETVELKKKKRFAPVIKIEPKKINLYDKRFRTYCCRNNC